MLFERRLGKERIIRVSIYTIFLTIVLTGLAQAKVEWSLATFGSQVSGTTTYRLEFEGNDPIAGKYLGGSELEFPLDTYVLGIAGKAETKISKYTSLVFRLNVGMSLSEPKLPMKDSDWIVAKQNGNKTRRIFSYTESEAKMDAQFLQLDGNISIFNHEKIVVFVGLGLRYQKFSYDVFGVKGWHLDEHLDTVLVDTLAGERGLTYRVEYQLPFIGMATTIRSLAPLEIGIDFAYSPVAIGKDRDDHLHRNKVGTGDCRGRAIWGGGYLTWCFGKRTKSGKWAVGLVVEALEIKTDGQQSQYWYGDDPSSAHNDTGARRSGIDYEMESKQSLVKLFVQYRF